jgi:hypothetical protein
MRGDFERRVPSARITALALIAIALLGGCGSSDAGNGSDADTSSSDGTDAQVIADPPVSGGDKVHIRENLRDVQDSLLQDRAGICFEITDQEERRLAALSSQPRADCFTAVGRAIARRRELGVDTVRSRVLSVKLTYANRIPVKATAIVEDPTGAPYPVRLVLQDGEWAVVRLYMDKPSGLGPPAS